jgi:hypothetical protein
MTAYEHAESLLRELAAPRRNQFFYGKRMDVQHFRMEQDYGRMKQALINRLTLGKGVVCGLRVRLQDNRLGVDPGVAIDGLGREIVVPVRSVIDPAGGDALCCGGATPIDPHGRGLFTLWVCYRECNADYQPVLVSDCNTRSQCAAGTAVETFCFKLTPGLAPLQEDPRWCAGFARDSDAPGEQPRPEGDDNALLAAAQAQGLPEVDAIRDALSSRRRALCMATSWNCAAEEKDACVPIAVVVVGDGRPLAVDECLVRPRVYSNAVLLDLILCLAKRLDECCQDADQATLLRIAAIDFLRRGGPGGEQVVARVASPLAPTELPLDGNTDAIRIRFTKPFARGEHAPTTPGLGDRDFERHNLLIVRDRPLERMPYVPGTLALEAPDVLRFDLLADSPYSRGPGRGWERGRYRLRVCGTDEPAKQRRALTDVAGVALDGEPSAPADGAISGDGTPAGDFSMTFVIG